MFENAKWIRYNRTEVDFSKKYNPVPYIGKTFYLKSDVENVTVNVCGLGQAAYFFNGKQIPDSYRPTVPCTPCNNVVYNTYDVTRFAVTGKNRFGLMMGYVRGYCEEFNWVPSAIVQIDILYKDGTKESVVSDGTFKAALSHIVFSLHECGEVQDLRKAVPDWCNADFCDAQWENVVASDRLVVDSDETYIINKIYKTGNENRDFVTENFRVSNCPKIRKISEKSAKKIGDGLYDFEITTAGYVKAQVVGKRGNRVKIEYSERLTPDKKGVQKRAFMLSKKLCPEMYNTDEYILGADGTCVLEQVFSVHGFRYVYVSGDFESIKLTAVTCHTDMKRASDFVCNNEMLNKIHDACANSIATCTQTFFCDNPKRDVPWIGDQMLSAESTAMLFESFDVHYENMLMCKESITPDRLLSHYAPAMRAYTFSDRFKGPDWSGAVVYEVPYYVYKYSGNSAIVEDMFSVMEKQFDFFKTLSSDGNCLLNLRGTGDWSAVKEGCSLEVCMTAYYAICAEKTVKFCENLGKDPEKYINLLNNIKHDYRKKYVHNGKVSGKHITEFLLPVWAGLLTESEANSAVETAVQMIKKDNMAFTFGTHGLRAVFDVLSERGYADIIFKVLTNEKVPGYAAVINRGYNSVPERFDYEKDDEWENTDTGGFSVNHFFFSMVAAWFYKWVAGIKVKGFGYENVEISPEHIDGIHSFSANLHGIKTQLENGVLKVDCPYDFTLKLNSVEEKYPAGRYEFPF